MSRLLCSVCGACSHTNRSMTFDAAAFSVFDVDGLDGRMEAIRAQLWPLFNKYGRSIAEHVQLRLELEQPLFVHVAKHLRRTAYAPESTWVAIGGDKRGYKKYPHFQIAINAQYVAIVLACIDNPLHEKEIAADFSSRASDFDDLSFDYVLIADHTRVSYEALSEVDCKGFFERVASVKKAEWMIGRVAQPGSAELALNGISFKTKTCVFPMTVRTINIKIFVREVITASKTDTTIDNGNFAMIAVINENI